jgi:hypothetical protein
MNDDPELALSSAVIANPSSYRKKHVHRSPLFRLTMSTKLLRRGWRKLLPELGHRGNPAGVSIHFKIDQPRHLQSSVPSNDYVFAALHESAQSRQGRSLIMGRQPLEGQLTSFAAVIAVMERCEHDPERNYAGQCNTCS